MGAVYEVKRLDDGQRLALKLMSRLLLDDPKARRRFEREVQAGRAMDHPAVARVLDSGVDDRLGVPWLAMEFAEGTTLTAFVEDNGPLGHDASRCLLEQLFSAVGAAHRLGIVHRDLKPDNVMVARGEDGELVLKVLDFGIAKDLRALTGQHTAEGLGTPMWTAPDQGKAGYVAQPRDDVWALGLIAFFVWTGQIYWVHAKDNRSLVRLSMELLRSPIEAPSVRAAQLGVPDRVPEGFDAWFLRAVHRDAGERFEDASTALEAWRAAIGGSGDSARTGAAGAGKSYGSRLIWALGALLLVAAAVVFLLWRT